MEIIAKEAIYKIFRGRKILEKKLGVGIKIERGGIVNLTGDEINVFVGEKVIEAVNKGFSVSNALLLTNENYVLEEVPIKSITKRRNLSVIRARVIGTKGKTLKTISELSGCHLALQDNIVSVIGPAESVKSVITAIKSLIKGSKQSNVYYYLEQARKPLGEELKLEPEE